MKLPFSPRDSCTTCGGSGVVYDPAGGGTGAYYWGDDHHDEHHELGIAAIAGIVVAALAIIIVGLVLWLFLRRRRSARAAVQGGEVSGGEYEGTAAETTPAPRPSFLTSINPFAGRGGGASRDTRRPARPESDHGGADDSYSMTERPSNGEKGEN